MSPLTDARREVERVEAQPGGALCAEPVSLADAVRCPPPHPTPTRPAPRMTGEFTQRVGEIIRKPRSDTRKNWGARKVSLNVFQLHQIMMDT